MSKADIQVDDRSNAILVYKMVGARRILIGSLSATPVPSDPWVVNPHVTASKLLGRGSSGGAGSHQEISLGTNLEMAGTTLNATGGAPAGASAMTILGLAGEDGQDGFPGPPGASGSPGAAGSQGVAGAIGPMGMMGQDGEDGIPGPPGPAGVNGTIGSNGATGPQGPTAMPVWFPDEPDLPMLIPGPAGATGATGSNGADGVGITVKKLTNNRVSDGSPVTTMVKATELDQTLATGTWVFHYYCVWQTSVTGSAIKLGVNFSGTQTTFLAECTGFEATTAASTGAQTANHAAFGLRAGGQTRAPSTSTSIFGPISTDATGSNTFAIIRGLVVVTVSGDLQLYFGSETTGSTQTLMAPTSLVLFKTA